MLNAHCSSVETFSLRPRLRLDVHPERPGQMDVWYKALVIKPCTSFW